MTMQVTFETAEQRYAAHERKGKVPAGLPVAEWASYHIHGAGYQKPQGHSKKKSDAAYAYMNHGRWVVQCVCGEGQLASESDPRFYCTNCRNQQAGGKSVDVIWPDQQTKFSLSKLMSGRPRSNMNWLPGETLDAIARENREMGV